MSWSNPLTIQQNTGNVGIGNSSPNEKLEAAGRILASKPSNLGRGLFLQGSVDPNHYSWLIAAQEHVDAGLEFTPSTTTGGEVFSSPAVVIKQSGNVGIGTTAPYSKLSIYESVRSTSSLESTPVTAWITQDYSKTVSGTDYAIGLDITKNGYNIPDGVTANGYQIGIVPEVFVSDANFAGTIDKQYAIWARTGMNVIAPAGARTINNAYGIYIEGLTTLGGTIHNHYGVYQAGLGTKNYFEGNVGIGTTGPSGKVHINAGTASPALRIDTDNAGPWGLIIRNLASGTAGFEVYQSDDGKTHMFSPYPNHGITLDTNGNVGIGTTSPNLGGDRRALTVSAGTSGDWIARLEVQGTRSTDNMYGALDFYHKANNTASIESYRSGADDAGNLTFWTRTSGMTLAERMRIDHLAGR